MEKLNKAEIVDIVVEKGHLTKRDAKVAVDLAFEMIEKALLNGEDVNITNFGTFSPIVKKQREGTDPKTHQIIIIPETTSVSFKPAKCLKEKLNK